jgi:dipeptidyl aminopeptidase/acylaminoacyl peptidase
MRRIPLLPAVAALVSAACALPAGAGATWPGKPGRIAYQALSAPEDGIYSIRPDGTGNRRIIHPVDGDVAWSRDGKRIAYFRTNEELWQARSDGSHRRLVLHLPGGAFGFDPAWSPTGKRLVFTLAREFESGDENVTTTEDVYIVRRDGKRLRKLRRGHDPTWSSRNRIAYANDRGDVFTISPNGRGRHIWVPQGSPLYVSDLDYSPDGLKLVYQQSTPTITKSSIRTIDLSTGRRTRFRDLTKQVNAVDLSWAPGGNRLAYVHSTPVKSGPAPPYELRTIRPDGTRRRTLFKFPNGASVFDFGWQTR